VALRIALASDDPSLRNLGMRTWVASVKRLTFDIVLPADVQKIVDQSETDPKPADSPLLNAEWLKTWMRRGFQQTFEFSDVDLLKNTGQIAPIPHHRSDKPEDFTLSGAQLTFSVEIDDNLRCGFRVAPASDLMLRGSASCLINQAVSPRLVVTAPMF
jgi:hypothetical protein